MIEPGAAMNDAKPAINYLKRKQITHVLLERGTRWSGSSDHSVGTYSTCTPTHPSQAELLLFNV